MKQFDRALGFRGGLVVFVVCFTAHYAGIENRAAADAYDPPSNYYNSATGTGSTLKTQLTTIVSTGTVSRTYGDFRYSSAILDRDPSNSANIRLVYNGASVAGAWDSGVTWNREHSWPQSLLGISVTDSTKGVGADEFELWPANPSVNSSRGNNPYGTINADSLPDYGLVAAERFPLRMSP